MGEFFDLRLVGMSTSVMGSLGYDITKPPEERKGEPWMNHGPAAPYCKVGVFFFTPGKSLHEQTEHSSCVRGA